MGARLRIESLTVRFGNVVALDDVDLDLEPGRLHGLVGPNGAGKTTVFDAITGFVRPQAGRVLLDDTDLAGASAVRRARMGIHRSFQSVELFSDLTISDNLVVALGGKNTRSLGDLLSRFDLVPYANVRAEHVPAGVQRLVGIARALAGGPSLLLLDEPGAGIHAQEIGRLSDLLRGICADDDVTILLVDHDMDLVAATCEIVTVLDFGRVIASGTPAQIKRSTTVMEAYLGR